ncbi:TadE family protein [Pilimelia anulata]|uniref:TadE family protein n=1 Tax=Pilimelia anulata TaxID=53371 RepID=UPI001665B478|nr:TadE family protein [Pilimelia anulata]
MPVVDRFRRALARRRIRLRGDRGATAVQLAILAPTVMLLIVGGVQAALSMYANMTVLAAAQQGVDAGRLYDAPPGAAQESATRFLGKAAGGLVTSPRVKAETTATTVTVTIDADAVSIIPGPWSRISKSSSGPREVVTGGAP